MKNNQQIKILLMVLLIPIFFACEKNIDNDDSDSNNISKSSLGKIKIDFITPHGSMKLGCVRRLELVLAIDPENLYKGNYFHSFNVSDKQQVYTLALEPGSYYFQAGLICICETSSCSGSEFSGGQYGTKFTADRFYITADETTKVVPAFR